MKLLYVIREVVFGFGLAALVPLFAYWAAQIVAPQPVEYPTWSEKKSEEQRRVEHEEYRKSNIERSRYVFYSSAIVGILSLLIAPFTRIASLSVGAILGGILTLIWGYWSYWDQINNIIKLVSLIAGLLVIIGLAYYFARREKQY